VIVVAARGAGSSYEERTCTRCFKGHVYGIERGAWVVCERCSGTGWVVVYVYPNLKGRPRYRD
jgi:hypothetical protein